MFYRLASLALATFIGFAFGAGLDGVEHTHAAFEFDSVALAERVAALAGAREEPEERALVVDFERNLRQTQRNAWAIGPSCPAQC